MADPLKMASHFELKMATSADNRAETLKALLVKFRKSITVNEHSEDLAEFSKLLDLNSQLAAPKNLCVNCWSLVSQA